ncbi:hypothetical protein EDD22DRAFT_1053889 [Suillus occidentalis]|nr:hypothetical protein EDD22DRAFT_1053889 [Suillus occidentalis]
MVKALRPDHIRLSLPDVVYNPKILNLKLGYSCVYYWRALPAPEIGPRKIWSEGRVGIRRCLISGRPGPMSYWHIGLNLITKSLPLGFRNPYPEFPSGRIAACRHARMHSESELSEHLSKFSGTRIYVLLSAPPNYRTGVSGSRTRAYVLPPDRTPKPGHMPEVEGYFYVLI